MNETPMTPERLAEVRSLDLLALMPERAAAVIGRALGDLVAEVERLRAELAARPTRAEAYRQVADELALMQSVEPDHRHAAGLYSAEQRARRMADAAERADDRARVETAATETGHPAHPAPCRVPASPDCTCDDTERGGVQ
ncbi:hypothetical protein [Streptomyces reniochalinae]|uniref:Uncharacterized protein n=1 Tax=Streptomyces reniochalinae TaxID=2250578 RepID=A0A367EW46_9ACTN|nr:hypothetical protein [Streptomyces reniochalinae]RCG21805.1 hypothetical protein DQ392_08845 [Streptomyces reniochalinae]